MALLPKTTAPEFCFSSAGGLIAAIYSDYIGIFRALRVDMSVQDVIALQGNFGYLFVLG
jgi:hypothetical protein